MTPIERLIDAAGLRCTVCGRPRCDCWERCPCGWSHLRGGRCRNPACGEPRPPVKPKGKKK